MNKIINKISTETVTIITKNKIVWPEEKEFFINSQRGVKESMENLFNKIGIGEELLIANSKNKMEINLAGKKIMIEHFKTKLIVSFLPNTYNFSNHKNINFIDGLLHFSINKTNYLSDIYEIILEFW